MTITTHELFGVKGNLTFIEPAEGKLIKTQFWESASRPLRGKDAKNLLNPTITAKVRFDDECGNRHMSFSVTGNYGGSREGGGGACHDMIEKYFPELAHLIKWHLMDTDGPMHYPGNATYHAGDLDCHGLKKGEVRQIRNGRTGLPCWHLVRDKSTIGNYVDQEECPTELPDQRWEPLTRTGEGKERNFEFARSCAVWPEATDEQLSLPKAELTELLNARLPGLISDFKQVVADCGFKWMDGQREVKA